MLVFVKNNFLYLLLINFKVKFNTSNRPIDKSISEDIIKTITDML